MFEAEGSKVGATTFHEESGATEHEDHVAIKDPLLVSPLCAWQGGEKTLSPLPRGTPRSLRQGVFVGRLPLARNGRPSERASTFGPFSREPL